MTATSWIERVTALHQWSRRGERAPHKPLLLLYALGQLQRSGSSRMAFANVEADLKKLLQEFGPPHPTSPGYPFHHLVSDGLWVVQMKFGPGSPGPNLRPLRAGAVGELAAEFARDVEHDPILFAGVVRALLDANFPASLHEDILDAVGISLHPLEMSETNPPSTRTRDPAFREAVLLAYEYRCAACGYDGQFFREAVGIEAAHIRWWAAEGPDEVANGVALCSLHHKLFDRGAIGMNPSHEIVVSSHFIGRDQLSESLVLALVGRPLIGPQAGQPGPRRSHVAWHRSQVFRGPARERSA